MAADKEDIVVSSGAGQGVISCRVIFSFRQTVVYLSVLFFFNGILNQNLYFLITGRLYVQE